MHVRPLLPLLIVPILLLAACGGDDDDDAPSDAPASATTTAVARTPMPGTAEAAELDDSASLPGEYFAPLEREHIPAGSAFDEYTSDPPSSGPHYSTLAPWGVNQKPIAREQIPHNLEHGGVVILYHCPGGCDDIADELAAYVDGRASDGDDILLAEYEGDMDGAIAAISWSRVLLLDEVDTDALDEFVDAHLCRYDPEFICSRAGE